MVMSVFSNTAPSGTTATKLPPVSPSSVTVKAYCEVPLGHVRRRAWPARLMVAPSKRRSFAPRPLQSQSAASVPGGSNATLWYAESFAAAVASAMSKLNVPK